MPTQVLLVEDHQMVRDGLAMLLERAGFKIVAQAADGQQAVRQAEALQPEVAVVDIALPLLNGLEAAVEIVKVSPKTKIIFLTMHYDRQYVLRGFKLGAKGFVSKSHAPEQLVQAIRDVTRGKTYLSPEMSQVVLEAFQSNEDAEAEPLTPRERQVLQLVAEGKSMKEVAVVLNISVKTAETHRARTMEKLDIHETASLVRYAIRRGLLQP